VQTDFDFSLTVFDLQAGAFDKFSFRSET